MVDASSGHLTRHHRRKVIAYRRPPYGFIDVVSTRK
jgi:hypothetical protein